MNGGITGPKDASGNGAETVGTPDADSSQICKKASPPGPQAQIRFAREARSEPQNECEDLRITSTAKPLRHRRIIHPF
jgi:hypothetical protein